MHVRRELILKFIFTIVFVVRATLGNDTTANSTVTTVQNGTTTTIAPTTMSSAQNLRTSPQATTTAMIVQKLCEFCNCTDHSVNCGNLKLDTILSNSEWPVAPLKTVTFEDNLIVRLKQFPNATINTLILRKNQISKIDARAFINLSGLRYLDLSHNRLTTEELMPSSFEGHFVPEAYEPLPKLERLDLSWNLLHSLRHNVFDHVSHLKFLNLSGNPFRIIHEPSVNAISYLPYLEELDLSHCKLTNLNENTFHTLKYLVKLDLSNNQFTVPPKALGDVESLQSLRLDFNPFKMSEPDEYFPLMPKLKNLSLSNMHSLIQIPKTTFSKLIALEVVHIENCPNLEFIDEFAFMDEETKQWPSVKKLSLSNNSLTYVPSSLLIWHKLEELHLMNNQWSCDCRNQHLIGKLLPERGKSLMGDEIGNLTCSGPSAHAGKKLISLATHHLRCLDKYDAHPERDAAILLGVLIGLLLAIPIVAALFILYRRGFIFCGSSGPASFSRAFYRRAKPFDDEF